MKLFLLLFCSYILIAFNGNLIANEQNVNPLFKNEIFLDKAEIIQVEETKREISRESYNVDGFYMSYWWELHISYNLKLSDDTDIKINIRKAAKRKTLEAVFNTFYLQEADILKISAPQRGDNWRGEERLMNFSLFRDGVYIGDFAAFTPYKDLLRNNSQEKFE